MRARSSKLGTRGAVAGGPMPSPLTRRQGLMAVGGTALALAAGASLWRDYSQGQAQRQTAAQLKFPVLDGRSARLMDWRGRVLLLNFWATSCSTCVAEMPVLSAIYQQFAGPHFDTLAVAMSYDSPQQVRAFARTRALPFSVGWDANGALARALGPVYLTPTTLLLDKAGQLYRRYLGPPEPARLRAAIAEVLNA